MPTDPESLRRSSGAIALTVGVFAAVAPRAMLRVFGVPRHELTGAGDFGWRLFAVRTVAIGAGILRGSEAARAVLLPVQVADQAVFAHALRSGSVPRRSAAMAMAVSGVLIVLDLLARRATSRSTTAAS